MKKNPKVSIIIPVYNGSNYLKEAIDSALAQTYKNIEIIVINDGSNDAGKTESIALSYKDKIKYISKENGGVSSALNVGIKNMTGDYFSWLSHDDLYYPNKVSKQIEELNNHDENTILYSNYSLVDQNTTFINDVILDHDLYNENPINSIINMDINGITLLIPKKAFEECGNFDEQLRCVQDYELWVKMMNKYKFFHMKDILGSTRIHSKQVSNVSPKVLTEGNEFYKNLVNKIAEEQIVKFERSKYLFLDNLETRLRYTSNYIEAADHIKKQKKELLNNIKIDKLYWLINACQKSETEIKKINDRIDKNVVEIVTYGKKVEGFNYINKDTKIDSKYSNIYLGDNIIDFKEMLKILTISNCTIIGNYLLPEKEYVYLDKYSKFIHMDHNSLILKNCKLTESMLYNKFEIYKKNLTLGNIISYKFINNDYQIEKEEINEYLKYVLNENKEYKSIGSLCYQISVIHNKISKKTGEQKVRFYEHCQDYENLKYSRAWHLYNKLIKILKRNK